MIQISARFRNIFERFPEIESAFFKDNLNDAKRLRIENVRIRWISVVLLNAAEFSDDSGGERGGGVWVTCEPL